MRASIISTTNRYKSPAISCCDLMPFHQGMMETVVRLSPKRFGSNTENYRIISCLVPWAPKAHRKVHCSNEYILEKNELQYSHLFLFFGKNISANAYGIAVQWINLLILVKEICRQTDFVFWALCFPHLKVRFGERHPSPFDHKILLSHQFFATRFRKWKTLPSMRHLLFVTLFEQLVSKEEPQKVARAKGFFMLKTDILQLRQCTVEADQRKWKLSRQIADISNHISTLLSF